MKEKVPRYFSIQWRCLQNVMSIISKTPLSNNCNVIRSFARKSEPKKNMRLALRDRGQLKKIK